MREVVQLIKRRKCCGGELQVMQRDVVLEREPCEPTRGRLVVLRRALGGIERKKAKCIAQVHVAHFPGCDFGSDDVSALERTSVTGESGPLRGHELMFAQPWMSRG